MKKGILNGDLNISYETEPQKSYAYKLVFQDPNKTLTEEEVMNQFNQIIASCQKVGYSLREK